MSRRLRVAIAGAGLAGLAAALDVKHAGAHVEVFERTRLLGGKATSFSVAGVEVDNGQHVTLRCCTEFSAFLARAGMRDALIEQPRFAVTLLAQGRRPARLRERALPAPLHLLPSLLAHPGLGMLDVLRIAAALRAAQHPVPAGEDMDAWLRRHGQSPRIRHEFWDPFLVPALNARMHEVAAADALFVVRTAFLQRRDAARIGWTRVPLARVAAAAAARADALHLRDGVTGVLHDGTRVQALQTHSGRRDDFDAVLLAVPPQRLRALLPDAPSLGIAGLERFATRPVIDVHLWYAAPEGTSLLGDSGFAAVLRSPVQWVFEKAPGYLCCSLSAADELMSGSETSLVSLCHTELQQVLPRLRGLTPQRSAVTRDADATFLAAPGLQRPGAATRLQNLVIAGAWTATGWPATMESAVRSGRIAAALLLRRAHMLQTASHAELAHAV